jgi:hypothetical protein
VYKAAALFLLKELGKKDVFHIDVFNRIIDVIENPINTNEYVYKFIYNNISNICASAVDDILSALDKERRL